MGKKIVLPTDFSKNSWCAIQYAIKLYENQDCDFFVLNTYATEARGIDSNILLDPDRSLNKMAKNRSTEGLGDILNRLSEIEQGLAHRFHVMSQPMVLQKAVKEAVENLQVDLVVMGAKGMTNSTNGKYGRHTMAVIESVRKCPVLLVPENVSLYRPKEIVLATNFNTDFKVSEIKYLAEIAQISNASIRVLSLADTGSPSPQQEKNKMLLCKYFKGIDHSFNILENAKMAEALNAFINVEYRNMISYMDKKPSFWEQIGFGKPTLGKLGYYEDVPVLALNG